MERIEETLTKITYRASDGQVFNSKQECLRREAAIEYTSLRASYVDRHKLQPIRTVSAILPDPAPKFLKLLQPALEGYFDSLSGYTDIFRVLIRDDEDRHLVELFCKKGNLKCDMDLLETDKMYLFCIYYGRLGDSCLNIVSCDEFINKMKGILDSLEHL